MQTCSLSRRQFIALSSASLSCSVFGVVNPVRAGKSDLSLEDSLRKAVIEKISDLTSAEWWINMASGKLMDTIEGAVFSKLMPWSQPEHGATADQVNKIVENAVAQIKAYIDKKLDDQSLRDLQGHLRGLVDLMNEYEDTRHEPTLDRVNQDSTILIESLAMFGSTVLLLYPVAVTLKLAALVEGFHNHKHKDYVKVYSRVRDGASANILAWQTEVQNNLHAATIAPTINTSGILSSPRRPLCFYSFEYLGTKFSDYITTDPDNSAPCEGAKEMGERKLREQMAPHVAAAEQFDNQTALVLQLALAQWRDGERKLVEQAGKA